MILSDKLIKEEIVNHRIKIAGVNDLYIGPSSLDLHLDNKAMILKHSNQAIRTDEDCSERFEEYSDWDEITIYPGEFYILHTKEFMSFPRDVAGFIQGRSSIARLGINVHAAGFFDPGFAGTATLEVTNFTNVPITIPKDTRICQMVFLRVDGEVDVDYSQKKDSKYMGQCAPKLTEIQKDYENKD